MPEGPEVFQKAAKLRPQILGKQLQTLIHRSSNHEIEEIDVGGATVDKVNTKGKKLWLELSNHMFVLFSFALEGHLEIDEEENMTNHDMIAQLKFSDGTTYSHKDHMRIAKCYYTNDIEPLLPRGVDPLHELYGMREWLDKCFQHRSKAIARFIVDQNVICGVGNIYRSEVLNLSEIYPTMKIRDIEEKKLEVLLVNIHRVLGEASKGKYNLQVHGKKFDPDGRQVTKVRIAKSLYVWSSLHDPFLHGGGISPSSSTCSKKKISDIY